MHILYTHYVAHRVRLVDGPNPHTGRVEVYTNSTGGLDNAQWGSICGDNWWSLEDAMVVCHQLGYPDAVRAIRYGLYGEGAGPSWMDNVRCHGTEVDIFTCRHHGIGYHHCGHYKTAGVQCTGNSYRVGGFS